MFFNINLLFIIIQLLIFICILIAVFNIVFCYYLIEKIFNLIAIFLLVSFFLFVNGFEFIPLIILIIYVGSIAILFLFVIIIINPDYSDIVDDILLIKDVWHEHIKTDVIVSKLYFFLIISEKKNIIKFISINKKLKSLNIILFKFFIFSYFFIIIWCLYFFFIFFINYSEYSYINLIVNNNSNILINLLELYNIHNDIYYISLNLYDKYAFHLWIIGFILIVAIIGVIVLGIRKSLYVKRQNISEQFFRYRV